MCNDGSPVSKVRMTNVETLFSNERRHFEYFTELTSAKLTDKANTNDDRMMIYDDDDVESFFQQSIWH